MTDAEILQKARDILSQRGWCQKKPTDAKGHVCAITALEEAYEWAQTRSIGAYQALRDVLPRNSHFVSVYNDSPKRTMEEVLTLYDHAIERAKTLESLKG